MHICVTTIDRPKTKIVRWEPIESPSTTTAVNHRYAMEGIFDALANADGLPATPAAPTVVPPLVPTGSGNKPKAVRHQGLALPRIAAAAGKDAPKDPIIATKFLRM